MGAEHIFRRKPELRSEGQTMKSIMQLAREQAETLPSPDALERFGTYNMLSLIHDAVGHLVSPLGRLQNTVPVLEQIANSLAEQQTLLKEMLSVQKDATLVHFVANRLEKVPSLAHAVLNRDLGFVSANTPYSRLFGFSQAQLHTLSFNDLLHPRDSSRFDKIIKPLLSGSFGTFELIEWRLAGAGTYVLTKDTLWGVGSDGGRGPEYVATVSELIANQDEAAEQVERARRHNRRASS
jgi:PAS domain-containing protein